MDFTQFYRDLFKQMFLQNWKIFLIIAVLIIISNLLTSKRKINLKGKYKKAKFLTKNEQINALIIKRVADRNGYIMSCKVRMADIVEPKNNDTGLFAKVSQKHFDFVLSDITGKVVLVIEIDDNSHNSKSAKERDKVKNIILSDVGIPLLRTYNITEQQITNKLKNTY